jgi:hypothetical protein
MKDWVKIAESRTGIDLEMDKALLWERESIRAVVLNQKVSAYDLGNWELYVHADYASKARNTLLIK